MRRETWEETGIEVGQVIYHSSQPWPGNGLVIFFVMKTIRECYSKYLSWRYLFCPKYRNIYTVAQILNLSVALFSYTVSDSDSVHHCI